MEGNIGITSSQLMEGNIGISSQQDLLASWHLAVTNSHELFH
jgi:hypothetical protein